MSPLACQVEIIVDNYGQLWTLQQSLLLFLPQPQGWGLGFYRGTLTEGFFCGEKAYLVFCFLHFVIKMNKNAHRCCGEEATCECSCPQNSWLGKYLFFPPSHILEVGVADEYIQTPSYKSGHEA